ncbi:hypothetical protein MMC19_005085 [Ptychographa xylographoides]|nr:hypothetical protein [Ptychographa xylographoides]
MFPPAPSITDRNVSNLHGKVFIVTGAASGIGLELAMLLYGKSATVYIATRSLKKINLAISHIESSSTPSKGKLVPLLLDLADLSTIKRSAEEFLAKEERLDVLVHNAGVMKPARGSKTKQGHDLEMGTNCLGPFLFNHLLEPILKRTAAAELSQSDSVRVVWLASLIAIATPTSGIVFDQDTNTPMIPSNQMENYMQSKVGNVFLASETAKRLGKAGIISVGMDLTREQSVHPGILLTNLQRTSGAVQKWLSSRIFRPARFGAYSELFAALSPEITSKGNGGFIIPFGRFGDIPGHIKSGLTSKAEGGNGLAIRFEEYCLRETQEYF